jgi:hypothetical protein
MATIKDDIRFAVDPVAFAEEVLPRIDPDIEKLDAWQEEFLKTRARRVLINAFRQSGKSTLTGILALHRALYYPRSLVLILAPSLRQAGEFFEKVSTGYSELLGGGLGIEAESDRKLGIKLTNGSRIEALPGTQKSTRGFSKPSLIIIDEAAQIDDALYTGVMPTASVASFGGCGKRAPYSRGCACPTQTWTGCHPPSLRKPARPFWIGSLSRSSCAPSSKTRWRCLTSRTSTPRPPMSLTLSYLGGLLSTWCLTTPASPFTPRSLRLK